jgi:hypothetical protein
MPPVNAFDDETVPGVPAAFQPRVRAVVFYNGNAQFDQIYPVGIRIGDTSKLPNPPYNIDTTNFLSYTLQLPIGIAYLPPPPYINPNTLIFRRVSTDPSKNGESLLPIAVYRIQIANTNFPVVSGNMVQVTPLLEQLAYGLSGTTYDTTVTIYDLLIAGGFDSSALAGGSSEDFLYLRDQQPVLLGASYAYYVARFNSQHEVSEIIPAGIVTIPSSLTP